MTRPTVMGVDGCPGGWVAVARDCTTGRHCCRVLETFAAVMDYARDARVVAVDIPIGLLDKAEPGGRECDRRARKLLGGKRASSVFPAPVRAILPCRTYAAALAASRASSPHGLGLSKQCHAIAPKVREVDDAMTPALQNTVREIHPELCFLGMNGGQAVREPKRTAVGLTARAGLLRRHGFECFLDSLIGCAVPGAEANDLLDACAACWTAARILDGTAIRVPDSPEEDARGLRMEMWY